MKETIVVDTNILLSALISDSKTREIVVNIENQLVAPEAIYQEINKYRDLIRDKAGINEEELDELLDRLFKHIQIVSNDKIKSEKTKADQELKEVDKDDTIFLAAAIAVEGVIWSDDKDLQKQDLVEVYTTEEILELVYRR
ncbi:MAG: PIN domain-containing protein [Candidatus Nanohaloarchaea archaeon]